MWSKIKNESRAWIIALSYWLLSRFWKVRHIDKPPPGKRLYAHWHGDELLLISVVMRQGMAVMSSFSKDGLLMKRVLELLGFFVVRGSSSRSGGSGLKGLIDAVKQGREASLAVDGPRGPLYEVKPGIIKLAQESGWEIIPGAAATNKRFVFKKAWNQCYLPLPFSTSIVIYGKALSVPKNASETEIEKLRLELQHSLIALKAQAEQYFDRPLLEFESVGV